MRKKVAFSAKAIGGELKAGTIAGASATYNTVKVGFEVSKILVMVKNKK